tara:strand:- start:1857 stop:2120 length:264 start_codon:yes stop_codon:yes gene_type:complete
MNKIKFQTVTIKLTKAEVQNCITSLSLTENAIEKLAIGEYNTANIWMKLNNDFKRILKEINEREREENIDTKEETYYAQSPNDEYND